jgi:hypothetical protein
MKIKPEYIAPCGLYCGVCAIMIADRDNNEHLKEKLVNLYKGGEAGKGTLPNSEDLKTSDIKCKGCLSDVRFMHCENCEIRDCTKEKGYTGCHECSEFPCRYIQSFPMTIGKKVIMRAIPYWREVGTEKWIEDEEARYICPNCQNSAFRGVIKCNRCKENLDLD